MHPRTTLITGLVALALMSHAALAKDNFPVGSNFPDLHGRDVISGDGFKLSKFEGKVVLVDFWATWCGPCVAELPNVKKVYEKYHEQGLEIVSISLDSNLNKLRSFVEKQDMDWHHFADGKGWKNAMAKECGVHAIPQMYILGRNGKVAAADVRGYEALSRAVEKALADQSYVVVDNEDAANRMLGEADALRGKGEHGPAVALYRQIRKDYSGTKAADKAKVAMNEIAADPELKAQVKEYLDREAARKTLTRARELRESGHTILAKKYYKKVVERYGKTPEAETAKAELGELDG